jgi:uncharacterized protein
LALYFLDTSALTKLYVREPGSDFMLRLANDGPRGQFVVLSITSVEFRSAVRRRQREGDIARDDAEQIVESFSAHLESQFLRQPLTETLVDSANDLIDRHTLRAYDALQLAGCLALRSSSGEADLTFLCADKALCQAAVSEEVSVINPEGNGP